MDLSFVRPAPSSLLVYPCQSDYQLSSRRTITADLESNVDEPESSTLSPGSQPLLFATRDRLIAVVSEQTRQSETVPSDDEHVNSNNVLDEAGKMRPQPVCAVIVTYRPSPTTVDHLSNVLPQVQGLVVVDNGSNKDELGPLQAASSALGFHLIENGENLGVAEALNQGIQWAKSQGYLWVTLFDQDSGITEEFINQMFRALETHPDNRPRVARASRPRWQPNISHDFGGTHADMDF